MEENLGGLLVCEKLPAYICFLTWHNCSFQVDFLKNMYINDYGVHT